MRRRPIEPFTEQTPSPGIGLSVTGRAASASMNGLGETIMR